MDIPVPLRPRTLPQSVLSAGARLVGLIYAGGRAIVLIGPHGSGKSLTLDIALDGMPGAVHRIVNHGIGALDLRTILAQLGADPTAPIGLPTLIHALRADPARPVVLAIDDAQTLTQEALATLAMLPPTRDDDFAPILILAGTPGLRTLLARRSLRSLRARDNTLLLPAPGAEQGAPIAATLVRPLRAGTVAGVLVALALGAMLAFGQPPALEFAGAADAPTDATADAPLAPAPLAPASLAPSLAPAPVAPVSLPQVQHAGDAVAEPSAAASAEAQPTGPRAAAPAVEVRPDPQRAAESPTQPASLSAGPTEAQLRQDFLAFLDRAGPDTARLPPARREALFGEYLAWRVRSGEAARSP